jgi:hypothetical protein
MFEALTGFLSAAKGVTPVILAGIALATGIGLFADDQFITKLGLVDLRTQYRSQLGIVFISASSLLAAQAGAWIWQLSVGKIQRARRGRRELASLQDSLRFLTPEEQAYLVPFIHGQSNTLYFRIEDGIAGGLVAKRILYRSSNIGHRLTGFAHNIQPWAKEYLDQHPDLLENATVEPIETRGW